MNSPKQTPLDKGLLEAVMLHSLTGILCSMLIVILPEDTPSARLTGYITAGSSGFGSSTTPQN